MIDRIEGLTGQEQTSMAGQELRLILQGAVRHALRELVEEEVAALCGPRYGRDGHGEHYRAGSAPSSVYVQGRKEPMARPRVRRRSGDGDREVELFSWKAAQDPAQWEESVMRAVLCGVSGRNMASLDAAQVRGMSKSTVSRLWQDKAAGLVEQVQQSDLSQFDLLVLMIDAVVLAKDLVATVALGIDARGTKKVLGFRIGGSENAQERESFEEAGEDLPRLFGLEVPNTLNRPLLSTNCIVPSEATAANEVRSNVFKNLRRHIGRVCRWRTQSDQGDRWMASGLKLAEAGFRRIVAHSDFPALVQALEKSEAKCRAA